MALVTMRTLPLKPSVQLPRGPRNSCEGCAEVERVIIRTLPPGLSVQPCRGP